MRQLSESVRVTYTQTIALLPRLIDAFMARGWSAASGQQEEQR